MTPFKAVQSRHVNEFARHVRGKISDGRVKNTWQTALVINCLLTAVLCEWWVEIHAGGRAAGC